MRADGAGSIRVRGAYGRPDVAAIVVASGVESLRDNLVGWARRGRAAYMLRRCCEWQEVGHVDYGVRGGRRGGKDEEATYGMVGR